VGGGSLTGKGAKNIGGLQRRLLDPWEHHCFHPVTSPEIQVRIDVSDLLRKPQFPDLEFGVCGPDSLRLLNEDLLYADNEEAINDALNSIVEVRDALNSLLDESQMEAAVYSSLCEEVDQLQKEDREELTRVELDNLINKYAKELWCRRLQRFVDKAGKAFTEAGLEPCFYLVGQRAWDEVESTRQEVRSWFGLNGGAQ